MNWAHPINRGLVAYWPMLEGAGLVTRDLSPNGLHGTLTLMTPSATSGWSGGVLGTSIRFDGTDDAISCGTSALFNPLEISAAAWIWLNAAPTNNPNVMSKNYNTGWRWRINNSTNVVSVLDRGATNIVSGTSAVPANTWVLVGFTGTSTGIAIYINGALDKAASGSAWGHGSDAGAFYLGQDQASPSEDFKGALAGGGVWSRGLTPAEWWLLYSQPYCRFAEAA